MAVVTIDAVVNVAAHALMVLIGLRLLVTVGTSEHREIVRIGMAGRAHTIGIAMVRREPGVVEGRAQPAGGGVARRARGREASRLVIRIVGRVVIVDVARIAIRRQSRVVVVHVAHGARHRRRWQSVITGQRERCVVVIKGAIGPEHGVVTDLACRREPRSNVIYRRRGSVVIGLMTRDASRVGQLVIIVDMALRTLRAGQVEPRQRPPSSRVIESAVRPEHGVMAEFACRREAGGNMVDRGGRGVVIGLVAADAHRVSRGQVVIIVEVALRTLRAGQVEAGQGPARGRVVELTIGPQHRVVTSLTSQREAQLHVVNRRGRSVVILLVAAHAGGVRAGQVVVVVGMALRALRAGQVEAGQGPARGRVIELAVGPEHGVMALLAGRREPQLHVIDRRGRRVVVLLVAADASRVSRSQVVIVVDMALRTLQRGVRAGQRKSS